MKRDACSVKRTVLTALALAVFFFLRWEYLWLSVLLRINVWCYVAECVTVIAVYTLSLIGLRPAIPLAVSVAGCTALCVLYSFAPQYAYNTFFLMPLTYLPVLLFFINGSATEKKSGIVSKLCMILEILCVPLFIAMGVYNRGKTKHDFIIYKGGAFCAVVFILIGLTLILISFAAYQKQKKQVSGDTPAAKNGKKTDRVKAKKVDVDPAEKAAKREAARLDRETALSFRIAALPAALTCVPLIMAKDYYFTLMLSILWALDLILLGPDNRLIRVCADKIRTAAKKFVKEDRHETQ